jgi:predicted acyl esterase
MIALVRGRGFAAVAAALTMIAALALAQQASAAIDAKGSVEQVYVTGAEPGSTVKLLKKGKKVATDDVGDLGGALFREVKPGPSYFVKAGKEKEGPIRVLTDRSAPPNTKIYDQELPEGGYGYITMRDGTKLAANVSLPTVPTPAPYPTLIEYSGYGTADPDGPESGIAILGNLLGYAVVDVNMRGSGCSGGAFDFFEPLQSIDGYDIIETVARQDWVANKPGMMGISYGGISQLFTAQTQPPSLAAITPISVLDNTITTLYPGGILNTGFALEWAKDRVEDGRPAGPDAGQPWAYEQIQAGDKVCEENQVMHTEAVDLLGKIRANKTYKPKVADPLNPTKFVDKINVPTFMACQWQDEQTGGHCPTLASKMTGTDQKWFTFTNGVHVDSLGPETFNKWLDFLEIYVAKRRPSPAAIAAANVGAPVIYSQAFGLPPSMTLPPDPIHLEPTYEAAKAAFEALPTVRILFESGAGGSPGQPYPGFERGFPSFPPPGAEMRSWYFGADGTLNDNKQKTGADKFEWNAAARPPTNFTGNTGSGDLWTDSPNYQWSQPKNGNSVSYMTEPLPEDTTVLGDGEVEVWVQSKARNVDLQATISEVRPDGRESFSQGGWLRTGFRQVFEKKSPLGDPQPTYRKKDIEPLPKGEWEQVRIPLYFHGHPYREGSRIRVTIQAPGGDQPIWAWKKTKTFPKGTPWVAIARDKKHASRLVLPVLPGFNVPTELPGCYALRAQPCRDFAEFENQPFKR